MDRARTGAPWPTIVSRRTLPPGRRVVAVSDIHGNLPFFQGLMGQISLTTDDVLVLVGDVLEKGRESLALLRHVMSLAHTHTVWTVCGNCDGLVLRFFDSDVWDRGFFSHYLPGHPESTLRQMAAEIGYDGPWQDLPALRAALRAAFPAEWAFLRAMPTVIETDRFVFVHGGVPSLDHMERLDGWQCMKNDYFLEQGHTFSKYLVVGHCPVTLYDPSVQRASPILDHRHRVLSIDGGCVLKLDGQLNALILPAGLDDAFTWAAYDGLPTAVALEGQAPSDRSLNVRWGRSRVELLRRGEEFSLCRHLETGRTLEILTRYLYEGPEGLQCEDATDYRLSVAPGDVLSVVEQVSGGCLAKKEGITGWYWGRLDKIVEK